MGEAVTTRSAQTAPRLANGIAIASGKGGVGKTWLSATLCQVLAKQGHRVLLFDGDLGLVIGAGGGSLTLFDAVRKHGGRPANYCEIGGNPSMRKVKELTKLILSKPGVKKIAVMMNVVSNTRVDIVARGVIKGCIEASRDPSEVIAVFRIPGSWEEEGFKILRKYGVDYCDRSVSMYEAAGRAVAKMKAA